MTRHNNNHNSDIIIIPVHKFYSEKSSWPKLWITGLLGRGTPWCPESEKTFFINKFFKEKLFHLQSLFENFNVSNKFSKENTFQSLFVNLRNCSTIQHFRRVRMFYRNNLRLIIYNVSICLGLIKCLKLKTDLFLQWKAEKTKINEQTISENAYFVSI